MFAIYPISRSQLLLICSLMVIAVSACAHRENIQACNRMSYEQAPPVYERATALEFNRCAAGMASPGLQSHKLGLAANPFFCEYWQQSRDLNYDARRAIFEACTKGLVATQVPAIVSPQ